MSIKLSPSEGWAEFLKNLYHGLLRTFSQHQWARKRLGGKWECWYAECCSSSVWLQRDEFTRITGKRPGGCFGTCEEEDYTTTTK